MVELGSLVLLYGVVAGLLAFVIARRDSERRAVYLRQRRALRRTARIVRRAARAQRRAAR